MECEDKLPELIKAYPRLFNGAAPGCYSLVYAGWYQLVDELCRHLNAALSDAEAAQIEIRQIKEKFATLRFYVRAPKPIWERIRMIIADAETISASTCEQCGKPGTLRVSGSDSDGRGGLRIRCPSCHERELAER